jgi:iron(II)-dependent oxidoreductase
LGYDGAGIAQALHALRQDDDDLTVRAAAVGALVRLGHAAELNLVKIPAGEFLMGSDEYDAEKPPHQVYLDEYYIARYPVTNAEFERFVQAGGYRDARFWTQAIADGWWKDGKFGGRFDREPHDRPYNFGTPFNLPNHSVVGITWYEAVAYATWAGVRLPTETEWEKAARGTDGRRYPWGNTFDASRCNSAESRAGARGIAARIRAFLRRSEVEGATTPVGQFSPRGDSPYGVGDMSGNVWEWCADWYDANYYKNSPAQNPKGPDSGESRVLRGGAWYDGAESVRAAVRGGVGPWLRGQGRRFSRGGASIMTLNSEPSAL